MGLMFPHGDYKGIGVLVVCVVFWVTAATAVSLRVWARRIKKHILELNDYAIFIALFITTWFAAVAIAAVLVEALGQRMQDANASQRIILSKIFVAAEPIWSASNSAVKISILHLYTRIFTQRPFRFLCWGIMALTASYCMVVLLEAFLLCRPFAYNWDKSIDGKCADTTKAYLSAGIINLLIDVCIVVMPLPLLWKLQMQTAKKIGISAMFSIGTLILVVTILRIVSIQRLSLPDFTNSVTDVVYWSVLEPLLGIVNACLPVMLPALQRIFKSDIFVWTGVRKSTKGTSDKRHFGSALSALGSGDSKTKKFRRLYNDAIPLSNFDHRSENAGVNHTKSQDLEAPDTMRLVPYSSIRVTREWDVGSSTDTPVA